MSIAKDTINYILIMLAIDMVLASIAILIILYLNKIYWLISLGLVAIIIFSFFIIWTFRDPIRDLTINNKGIISPADGIVTDITKEGKTWKLTIRMSPFDVHMTRSPINGKVSGVHFQKGSHWPVYFPNYAKKNQRNTIIIRNDKIPLVIKVIQVSGIFARRTIAYVSFDDTVEQSASIGHIRFGSITHLEIETERNISIQVKEYQSVRAGITLLATFN